MWFDGVPKSTKESSQLFSLLNLGLQLHHLHDTSFVKARECSMQMTKLTRIHTSNPVNLYGSINLQYKTNPTLPPPPIFIRFLIQL